MAAARCVPLASSSIPSPPKLPPTAVETPRRSLAFAGSSAERQLLFNRIAPIYDRMVNELLKKMAGSRTMCLITKRQSPFPRRYGGESCSTFFGRCWLLELNDSLTFGQHRVWKRMAMSWSRAKKGDRVLDLCCGSGDLTFLMSQQVGLEGLVIGLDFSPEQLSIASARQYLYWKGCYKNIEWTEGNALDLCFSDCYFDAITMGFGLRNVVDKLKAMQEILRVLKPGSSASVLDFNKSTNTLVASFQGWMIENVVVPAASSYGLREEYLYLKKSIADFLTGKELENLAKEAGFSRATHYEIAGGLMGNLVVTK